MKRWTLRSSCLIVLCTLVLLSSVARNADAFWKIGKDKKQPRVIVIFVDMSGSTNKARRTVYLDAFEKVYQNFREGDRIIVGTITGRSFIDFKPAVDAEIPERSIWVNRLSYEKSLTDAKKEIKTNVENLLESKRGTPHTEIINSLNIADKIFHNEKRRKILIILSDMIQDSKEYNFEHAKVTDRYISKIISVRKKQKLIPKLDNVKVYVAGASAPNSNKFLSIEKFWKRYFVASGADFSSHRYGHSLIDFEKET